jgi:hypothetical protein
MRLATEIHQTDRERADAEYVRLHAAIRAEKRLLDGWRVRHGVAGDEERAELATYAAAAHRSIAELTKRIHELRSPEERAA